MSDGFDDLDLLDANAAGPGQLVPGIFGHPATFDPHPSAFFGLRVPGRPSPTMATVHGGGPIASGAGSDRGGSVVEAVPPCRGCDRAF